MRSGAGRTPPPRRGEPRPFGLPRFVESRPSGGPVLRAATWGKRPTVSISVLFPGAGSASDPAGREGLAELAAETYLGGTRRRGARELAESLDDLAAIFDASAGFDASFARFFVLEADLEEGLALLAEILTEPAFPEDEVAKARRRQIDLLTEQRTEPDFLARERLLHRLYPGHPYGRLAASETSLAALTRDDTAAFHAERLDLANATVVLVGASPAERLLRAAERALAGRGRARAAATPAPALAEPSPFSDFTLHLVRRPDSVQANLLFARPALLRNDPSFPHAVVANQSLGGGPSSRLFQVLREERGLTYGTYSTLSPRLLASHFGASIDCRTDAAGEALAGLLALVGDFAEAGPTPDEHERARSFLTGSFALSRETPGSLAQDETTRLLHGLPEDEWTTWRDRVAAVTPDEARAAARASFSPRTGVVAAVGDEAALRPVLERFGNTTVWDADGPRP